MFNVLAVPLGVLATAEFSFCGDPVAVNGRIYKPPSTERNLFCSGVSPIVCQSVVPFRKDTINRALSSVADRTLAIPLALESQNPARLIEAQGSGRQCHHAVVKAGRSRTTCSSVPDERRGIGAAQIIGVIVPGRQAEKEMAAARQLIQLRIRSQPERGDATAEMRCREENDFPDVGAGGRHERSILLLFPAQV